MRSGWQSLAVSSTQARTVLLAVLQVPSFDLDITRQQIEGSQHSAMPNGLESYQLSFEGQAGCAENPIRLECSKRLCRTAVYSSRPVDNDRTHVTGNDKRAFGCKHAAMARIRRGQCHSPLCY